MEQRVKIDAHAFAEQNAANVARQLEEATRTSSNEAEFRSKAANIFTKFADSAGIPLRTKEEYTVATGRADTVYNRLVVEYKAPGKLTKDNSKKVNEDAIEQIVGYIGDIAKKEHQKITRMAGVILDGRYLIFLRFFETTWVVDDPLKLNPESVQRLLKYLASVSAGVALVPDNLLRDFGVDSPITHAVVRAFYDEIGRSDNDLPARLFEQWKIFFEEVSGYQIGSARFARRKGLRQLANRFKLDSRTVDPPQLFYAIHTYFALVIKLIAWLAVTRYVSRIGRSFGRLSALPPEELRAQLEKLEQGGVFREFGIRNLLEGDFFGWYLHVWNDPIDKALRTVLERLADYDPGTLELNPEQTRDLLKKLYQYLMPREIRHDLGEYYTPDWLAQLVLNRLEGIGKFEGDPRRRFLDPACGSGTFLVMAIKAMRDYSKREMLNERETLDLILKNVVGIDLNPVAVIASRTNYLLAILDLLEYRQSDLDIPVYLADSVLIPTQSSDIGGFGNYKVPTAVGAFEIPSILATRERIDLFSNLLEDSVKADIESSAFLKRVGRELSLSPDELDGSHESIKRVYERIRELHRAGLNGIWARIMKNAFAPLFIGEFDYVSGNPPWINWQSLPSEYRKASKKVWERYGLFPHGGMDTILGKGKKDLSMLMTYVAADKFLKNTGRLGFVITQSVFKTGGSGQGFRRFKLPNGTDLRVSHVDDMVGIRPFKGTTNRTSIMVLERGRPTEYPLAYTSWHKTLAGKSIPPDASLREVQEEFTETERLVAMPVDRDDPTSPWLTVTAELAEPITKVLGGCSYRAHEGVNSGGANAVYWLKSVEPRPGGLVVVRNLRKGAKRQVDQVEVAIEPDLLFALIRGRDVARWKAEPSAHIILAQDPLERRGIDVARMQEDYPRTYAYLKKFERPLRERAAYKRYFTRKGKGGRVVSTGPFYSMFDVGDYTLAPWKVVWKYIATQFTSAVIGSMEVAGDLRPILPNEKLMLVGLDSEKEAHYLCAVLNSIPSRIAVQGFMISTQIAPHVLSRLRIPAYDSNNEIHESLAEASAEAHSAAARGNLSQVREVEETIDRLSADLWEISYPELQDFRRVRSWTA